MSVEQMSQVWKLDLPSNQKFILLCYADHADDEGNNVFPSLPRVAHKTGYSVDQVRRLSKSLVNNGLMELVEKGHGRGNTHRYRLTLVKGGKLPPFKSRRERVATATENLASDRENLAPMPPEPSEPSENHNPTESTEAVEEVKPIPDHQYYTTQFYSLLKSKHIVSLRPEQFGFHLAQMERMLKQYEPSDEEIQRVLSRMVEVFPSQPKVDALSAIQDVRLGRDTGEAWDKPAPWDNVTNPHSDEGEKARDKPRKAIWYASTLGGSEEYWQLKIDTMATHSQLMEEA